MEYSRFLDIKSCLKKKSHFIFGPRGTGKTTLIEKQMPDAKIYDLLDAQVYTALLRRPNLIEEENNAQNRIIVIDEVQKLPSILDEVQRLIKKHSMRFLLTGSSARKLKRGAANLLGGRAWRADLFPLTWWEISQAEKFDLLTYLNTGGLPAIYGSQHAEQELKNYVNLYLREEVQSEALVRNLSSFAGFIDALALANGHELNFDSLASDLGVSPGTVRNYLGVLEDTLLGFQLPGFTKTKKRKAISRSKFYMFDLGVVNQLNNRGTIRPKSELFGNAFEHFLIQEIRAFLSYNNRPEELCYWRSTSKFEVDVVIGKSVAIEIKSTELVGDKHLKGLRALKEEGIIGKFIIVSLDKQRRLTNDKIIILPWAEFLEELWQGKVLPK